MPEQKPERTYDVMMLESSSFSHMDESDTWWIRGFPTLTLATEFARRWVRSCVEEARRDLNDPQAWRQCGELALVPGHYDPREDIEFFIEHPATPEEVNWQAIKQEAGIDEAEIDEKETP